MRSAAAVGTSAGDTLRSRLVPSCSLAGLGLALDTSEMIDCGRPDVGTVSPGSADLAGAREVSVSLDGASVGSSRTEGSAAAVVPLLLWEGGK